MKIKFILLFTFSLTYHLKAQSTFIESYDSVKQHKMLLGIGNISSLKTDTSFSWFNKNYSEYKPDLSCTSILSEHKEEVSFLVFAGTWCGDTKRELPRFYKLLDEAGVKGNKVTLYLLNRTKKSPDGMTEKYHIKSVPTIILFVNGKEKKRFVESSRKPIEKVLTGKL